MNRNKVLELAREADACHYNIRVTPFLERFVALIERELRGDAEPVAWINKDGCIVGNDEGGAARPLYLHPAPAVVRQPLTDDEINNLQLPESGTGTIRDLVRVVELAHGIGGSDE